jgi:hypothetical protein
MRKTEQLFKKRTAVSDPGVKKQVKLSQYKPGQALRVPGI